MTRLAIKTPAIVLAACFAVLQMIQFEVLHPPQQPISHYHFSIDSDKTIAQHKPHVYLQYILQTSNKAHKKHQFKQISNNASQKFIKFIANQIDSMQIIYEHSQSRAFKHLKQLESKLTLEPSIAIYVLSQLNEEPPLL